MREYYYDSWLEDGTETVGYKDVGFFKPAPTKVKSFSSVNKGEMLPPITQGPVTRTDIVKYAGASWDFNPFHHDEVFAKTARSGGIIAHGMTIMAYLGRAATAYLGTADFNRFTARFRDVTRPGDVLTLSGTVKEVQPLERGGKVVLYVTATNQKGVLVGDGEVTATLPA